jgi:hypothetical protein
VLFQLFLFMKKLPDLAIRWLISSLMLAIFSAPQTATSMSCGRMGGMMTGGSGGLTSNDFRTFRGETASPG